MNKHVEKIEEIDDLLELQKFCIEVSLSGLEKNDKKCLFEKIDIRREELTRIDPVVECSELKYGEI